MQKNINEVYRNRHAAKLQAKVEARNNVHHAVRQWVPRILDALVPLVGQRATLQCTAIADRIKNKLPALPMGNSLRAYYHGHTYSLTVDFESTAFAEVNGEQGHSSQTATVGIADVAEHKLTKVCQFDPEHYRTNYTVQEVEDARAELAEAQRLLDVARSKLSHFGEHDAF